MAKGTSGFDKNGNGGYRTKSVTGRDGNKIDLSDSPLEYGQKDPNVTGKTRDLIEAFEKERIKNKSEYARVVDKDGTFADAKGSGDYIKVPYTDGVSSHTHPRAGLPNLLGGTFSTKDISTLWKEKMQTMRAAAFEGTYSITKQKGFNGEGLLDHYESAVKRNEERLNSESKALRSMYKAGKITAREMTERHNKLLNAFAVANHNALLSGQKKYKYFYTLERRGK